MEGAERRVPEWLLLVGIALLTFAVYSPALGFDFVYDDYAQIVETKQLNSWHMLPRYFSGHVWAWKTPGVPGPYYRPVFLVWLLLNQTLFGLSAPFWHLTSIVTHVAATLLVYAVAKSLTGRTATAAITALLFGVHPVHIESVAWISGITDPLAAVFLLGSFLAFARNKPALSYLLFALALLEKEIAIVLPLLLLAYAWLFERRALRAVTAYFLIAMIYLGVRLAVLHELSMTITPMALRDMLKTWPSLLVFYFRHLAWPSGLSAFYNLPVIQKVDLAGFWLPCAILAPIAVALAWFGWRSRTVAFAAAILLIPILPALNLRTFARVETVHDRYLYLPVMGFCLLIALALRTQWALAIPLAAALSFATVNQEQYWKDNVSLFLRGVEIAPNNEIANQCLGTALLLRHQLPEAMPYYQRALELNPNMFEALYSLGRIYYELGEYAKAEPYFERAIASNGMYSYPYLYYGMAKMKEGKLHDAEQVLRYAVRIKGPDDYREFHLALGLVLKAKGDRAGALREFESEVHENPDPAKALREIAALKAAPATR